MKRYLTIISIITLILPKLFSQKHIDRIDALIQSEKFDKASKEIKKQYKNDSTKLEYYYYIGNIAWRIGQYDAALVYLNKAFKIDSNAPSVIECMGIAYSFKEDTTLAIKLIKRAIALEPSNGKFYEALAGTYITMNQYQLALINYLKAYTIIPQSAKVLYNLGMTYKNFENYEKAIYYLSLSLSMVKDRLSYEERAYDYTMLDKNKEAIADLTKALHTKLSKNPYEIVSDGELYYRRSLAWKDLGNLKKSVHDSLLAVKGGYKQ